MTDTFSHAGIVVSSEILNDPLLEKGKLYLWESCLTHGVKSVHHPDKKFLGSQLRPLEEALTGYDEAASSFVGWLRYNSDARIPEFDEKFRNEFSQFFKNHNNVLYDGNPFSLCGALFKRLRPVSHLTKILTGTDRLMFCSELVSTTLVWCRIFPSTIHPDCVVPQDFLGYDNEKVPVERVPKIFRNVVYVTSTPFAESSEESRDISSDDESSTDSEYTI
jgi:hypothetical protein